MALEQCKRNRLSLGTAACIVGMQMVSTVVCREQLRRVIRIAYNRIEINHAVEFFAAENPGVDLLSHPFFLRSVESDRRPRRPQIQKRVFEWWVGRADDSNSFLMRPRNELPIAGDNTFRRDPLRGGCYRAGHRDVINSQANDHILNAGLREYVAV